MKKANNLLHKLFDTNVFGTVSKLSLFFCGLTLIAGQFLAASALSTVGVVTLGASIYKNISDAKKAKQIKQREEYINYEEYVPETTHEAANTNQIEHSQNVPNAKNKSNERDA